MKNMNKTVIMPILMVLALVVQLAFGVQIPEDVLEQVALLVGNAIAVILVIVGIFKNHKKEDNQNKNE